jgi:UPF0755 protein
LLALAAAAMALDLLVVFPRTKGPGAGAIRTVEVSPGIGPKDLAAELYAAGVINSAERFALWLRIFGGMPRIQAGSFQVADNLRPAEIIELLKGPGISKGVKVTIPEGYTLSRAGDAMEKAGLLGRKEFLRAAADPKLLAELGIPGPTAEGYLFPDTYFFDRSWRAAQVLRKMFEVFQERLASIGETPKPELNASVILASVVQAEAKAADEMPVIAGVYSNRLTRPEFPSRLLQADPSVSYGCEPHIEPRAPSCLAYSGVLTRAQLGDPKNPYNTYQHPGLPPGPICAPGLNALKAAIEPAKVLYFYFVVGKNGRHVFSVTFEEHSKAVAQYRQGR